jgi:hypothetical protein
MLVIFVMQITALNGHASSSKTGLHVLLGAMATPFVVSQWDLRTMR